MYSSSHQHQQQPQQAYDYGRPIGGGDDEDHRISRYSDLDPSRPGSYEHSNNTGGAGNNAYLSAQGQHPQPPSNEDDHHSTESSENSTKVGSLPMSPAASAYRQNPYAGEGLYKDPSSSDMSHDYQGVYQYPGGHHNNGSGYMDQPMYHPSAPSSPGHGRASTIGTDAGVPLTSSSRTALNKEWSDSPRSSYYGNDKAYAPLPPASPSLNEKEKAALNSNNPPPVPPPGAEKGTPTIAAARVNRLAWIDGLRGLASIVIFVHHFADLSWAGPHPEVLKWGTAESFFRNGQLAVAMYFLLGGRVLAHSFLRSAYQKPKPPKDSHGDPIPGGVAAKWTGPKWMSLSSSLFRRSIRLAFPAIVVGFMQWQLSAHHYFDTAIQAQALLDTDALWTPNWHYIGDFAGFLRFCIDLFTNNNHMYMLFVGSALWTTYDQFWGSIITYITAGMMAPLAPKGRYTVYTVMLLALFWTSSPNFLYVYGLLLADLHAAGYIRELNNHWKPTVILELVIMAVGTFLIAAGPNMQFGADDWAGKWTMYEGKFSYDPRQAWPQYMNFSYFVSACCIITWIEISHAMQWFVSWRIFVWLGKVSYGFYLMQFITIYAFMPHIVLGLNAMGNGYWDIVIPAFICCLIINIFIAWIAYHLFDRVGLKLGKWIWDGLFVTKPKNASAMPLKAVRAFITMCKTAPGQAVKDFKEGCSRKWAATKHNTWTIFHWRTPTTIRPAIPFGELDDEMRAQLHSTEWTTSISDNKEAVRTARLLKAQRFAWIPHMFLVPGLTFCWVYWHPTGNWTFEGFTFSVAWRFVWILSVPNCVFALSGFLTPDWAPTRRELKTAKVHREHIRNLFVLLVTKGSNEGAVRRGYNKLLECEKYHPAVKVIVLTDEPYVYPDLKNIVCPKAYKSPLGKAKYKARALDYFRYHVSLGSYDWILHMDEESTCDPETIRRTMEFVRYTPHHFGQGIILYNGEGYWHNWLFTVADGIRVGDDLARFHLQNTLIKRPVFGVHGSFLFTNGEMENECTWDFGSLAEDFEFSQDAWRRGFTCGRVHGIVREQSPTTVRDFLKQRRRWYMGIRDIQGVYGLPHLAVNLWTVGVFTLCVTLLNLPFMAFDHSLTPFWIALLAGFCFMTFEMLYMWGIFFQELDYGTPIWLIPIHLVAVVPIQPFASIMEGLSAIWAMSSEDFGKFEVIVKK